MRIGYLKSAEDALKSHTYLTGDDADMGKTLSRKGNLKDALNSVNKALSANPKNYRARFVNAEIAMRMRNNILRYPN